MLDRTIPAPLIIPAVRAIPAEETVGEAATAVAEVVISGARMPNEEGVR